MSLESQPSGFPSDFPNKLNVASNAIWFSSKSPDWGWLSNFSAHPFHLDGYKWHRVEHYYQAQKHLNSPHFDIVKNAINPLKARKSGRASPATIRNDWNQVKLLVMRRAIDAKFSTNRRLKEQLLKTGNLQLIHESSSDLTWGTNRAGEGNNLLGEILMEVRHRLLTAQ